MKALYRIFTSLALAGTFLPAMASAQDAVVVKLDLFNGDRLTQAFSTALSAAVSGDSRFSVVDELPADGLKIIVDDSVKPQNDDSRNLISYSIRLRLQSGKSIRSLDGICDAAKMDMCGRVVAEDSYNAYVAYMAKRKN